ncbi:MAG: AraC family transcriptional regulator [Clostridia bacterium]|nr:AraC family transcriptional regulator [Clostridia bacterium]
MFYEKENAAGNTTLNIKSDVNYCFPLHLHESFEFILITSGQMEIRIENTAYEVSQGQGVFIFPNQVHSLFTKDQSTHTLWIFSPSHIKAYASQCQNLIPECNRLDVPPYLRSLLLDLRPGDSHLKIKGTLYLLCHEFDRQARYRKRTAEQDSLLLRIFHFVDEHFNADCSIRALSEEVAYHPVYLSRYFKERVGFPFTEYVNRIRVDESCYRLVNTQDSITKIALDCGFESVRSFYRNFKTLIGQTANEYRKQNHLQGAQDGYSVDPKPQPPEAEPIRLEF